MTIFVICGICLLVFLLLFLWGRRHTETPVETPPSCSTCDGNDSRCMQECAVEQFREVLYTRQQNEVRDWANSLSLRHISVPDQLKDELFMMME